VQACAAFDAIKDYYNGYTSQDDVTLIHGTHPDKRADLASHMCHHIKTPEKHSRMVKQKERQLHAHIYCTKLSLSLR